MAQEHPSTRIGELLNGAWTASALAHLIARGVDTVLSADDPSTVLLRDAGLLEPVTGGYALAGREHLRGVEAIVLGTIRSSLGQTADIASGTFGWGSHQDDILAAQGESSASGGRGFASMIGVLPGLAEAFATGGVMLDVGVGVAALACAFAEAVPNSKVIGLDVEPRALALAKERVRELHLEDRVDLREIGIEAFTDEAVADVAHMSPVFIPPVVLPPAMRRVRAALKPGGWLALSGIVREDADGATRWMAYNAGGSALTDADVAQLAAGAGFSDPTAPPLPPGSPRVLVCRAI